MKFKAILSLLCTASFVNAASIVVQTGSPAVDIKTSNGQFLNSGSVMIGFFRGYASAGDAALKASLADTNRSVLSFIQSNFVSIGAQGSDVDYGTQAAANLLAIKAIDATKSSISGGIENSNWISATPSVVANSVQDGGLVRGTKIFLIVSDNSDFNSSTELGVFSASSWTISTSSAVSTLNMTLSQVDVAAEAYRGSIGSLQLAAVVPEPGVSLLALASLGLLARRRR